MKYIAGFIIASLIFVNIVLHYTDIDTYWKLDGIVEDTVFIHCSIKIREHKGEKVY